MKDISIPIKLMSLLTDGQCHSDEQFSSALGISKTAINNHIPEIVRDFGGELLMLPGKQYRLHTPLQLLDVAVIRARLQLGRIEVLPVIDSTNQYLIERIGTLAPGDACVTEYQFNGRGRRGRTWISTFGNNLCLSLYWRFKKGLAATSGLSLMVSIVIAEMLHRLGAEESRIKWPNDLYLNNRKLAGILVDIYGQDGDAAHVIIGTGINLAMQKHLAAGKINQDWINLQDSGIVIDRNALVAELINTLRQALKEFEKNGFAPFVSRWQAFDNLFNRQVKVMIGNREIIGIARGINIQRALLLEQDGKLRSYLGQAISLRNL